MLSPNQRLASWGECYLNMGRVLGMSLGSFLSFFLPLFLDYDKIRILQLGLGGSIRICSHIILFLVALGMPSEVELSTEAAEVTTVSHTH